MDKKQTRAYRQEDKSRVTTCIELWRTTGLSVCRLVLLFIDTMNCKRCWKTNVDVHTCTPNYIARWYDIWEITQKLTRYWLDNPDLRFWQMLVNIWYLKSTGDEDWHVIDPYNYKDNELLELLTVIEKG